MIWHVAACYDYDVPRAYHRLIDRLRKAGVDMPYVPVAPSADHDKRRQTLAPVIPGYVFLGFRERPDWRAVLETRGILHFLGDRGPERRVAVLPEADIERLRQIERDLARVEQVVARWRPKPGDRVVVRLANGPVVGQVQSIRNARVMAMMSFLGGLRPIEVALDKVEQAA